MLKKAFAGTFATAAMLATIPCAAAFADSIPAERCANLQTQTDSLADLDKVAAYLKQDVGRQRDARDLFLCANGMQTLPTVYATGTGRNYIRGDGWVSIVANNQLPFWNEFQAAVGHLVWAGKVLQTDAKGEVSLLNMMIDRKKMLFEAKVNLGTSVVDKGPAVILDYREVATDPLLSEHVISRVRDGLREITYRGEPSRIYVGRAYIFTRPLNEKFTPAWEEKRSYIFAANFTLDFRAMHQTSIPAWAVPLGN